MILGASKLTGPENCSGLENFGAIEFYSNYGSYKDFKGQPRLPSQNKKLRRN